MAWHEAPVDYEIDASNLPPGEVSAAPPSGRPIGITAEAAPKPAFKATPGNPVPGVTVPTDWDAKILGDSGMGFVHGLSKVTQGAERLGLRGLNAIGAVSDPTLQDFERGVTERNSAYDERIKRNFGPTNFASKAGEFGGEVAGTLPLSRFKLGKGKSVVSRVPTNAAQGGAAGALLSGPDDLGASTLTGAAFGIALPEVLRGALALIGKTGSWIIKKPPPNATKQTDAAFGDLTPQAQDTLKQSGVDWTMLPDATKRDVLQWVRQNGDKTTLTPLEAVRLGIFKGIGADPTKAMLTQSFDDFSREDLLANQRGGEAVRNAYANVNNAIGNHLEMKSLSMGGNTGDRSVAGLNVIDALQAGRDESKKAVTAAYEAVRNDPAIGNKVGMGAVRKFLVEEHPSLIASPKTIALANGVKAWLNREGAIGPGAKPLTVEKVEAFKQWLNKQWDPTDEKVKITLRGLKDAADESVLKAGNGDLFDQARTAYKLTKDTYDNKALVRSLLDQKNPVDRKIAVEDAWDRVVLRSDVAQFADLKSTLQKGSRVTQGPNESETVARGNQAWKDTQAATMEWLIEKARSAEKGPNDTAIYMHSKLKSAMDQIGKEKLQILFGGDGVSALNQVLEAMRLAKPIKGTTNPSGSGNRIIQFFQDYLPKMAGGAAGAAAGGPIGAAAGAATADAVVGGVRAARAAQSAETITRQPAKAIDKDRYPTLDLTGFVPPGAPSASVGMTVRDLVNRRAENRAK